MWGKTAGGLVLAVTVAAVSGCGSNDDSTSGKAPASAAPAPSVKDASAAFQAAVTKFDTDGGCLEAAPDTCWDQMQAVMEPARELRTAANADKAGPAFWSEAYALIDTMEKGIGVGKDLGATSPTTNRPDVLGSAHKLADWLDAHPTQ
ncbi:hypothetical protein ABTY59_32185 [Streptomyces sp. NPDC096079]|uniref:hypothetical protein n=1 Tax=Streptomyces sp. NPDC096079 TaxID=3155820 RepID=UPI00331CE90E